MHLNFEDKPFNLFCGDSYELLKQLPDNSIDSIVTDPPYGLSKQPDLNKVLKHWLKDEIYKSPSKGFMGKEWDSFVPSPILWKEAFRVLKPGGHILAFAGTRTQHLMAMSLGLAGFEIRDVIFWAYGSGFPKSQNISKAIDKMQGNEREVVKKHDKPAKSIYTQGEDELSKDVNITKSTSPDGIKWDGWGTALKPAVEPITLARKPINEKTIAKNVLKHGTGGINIDECRIKTEDKLGRIATKQIQKTSYSLHNKTNNFNNSDIKGGRFPSNLIIEENELNLSILEEKSKFFYSPKCSKTDRNEGLEDFEDKFRAGLQGSDNNKENIDDVSERFRTRPTKNNHPTVKPTDLMCYLIRLITPKDGIVLDPFNGSGSTGKAVMRENRLNDSNFKYIGIDLDKDHIDISKARIEYELKKTKKEKQ